MNALREIAFRLDDLPDGQARGFNAAGSRQHTLFVVRKGESVYGYLDACPHHGDTPMAWREHAYLNANASRIVCSAHGAQFDVATGVCTLGPCLGQKLTPVPVWIGNHREVHVMDIGITDQRGDKTS